MFTEVMNENVSTEKVISFLQSALLKQKNLQQYIRFKPSSETEAALEKAFEQLVEELLVNDTGSAFICKGLMVRIFGLLSTGCEFSPETEAALEKAFEQLVEELLVNDTGSAFICKGLMVRIFGLLSTGCEFSLSRELRQEMSWIVYEEITEYIAHHYELDCLRGDYRIYCPSLCDSDDSGACRKFSLSGRLFQQTDSQQGWDFLITMRQ